MHINIAIAPINWTNDDLPALGGDICLETCLREAQQAGYIAIEKGGKFPKTYAQQKSALAPYDLRMIGGWHSGNLIYGTVEQEKHRVAEQLALYQKWQCPVMVYGETGGSIQLQPNTPICNRIVHNTDTLKTYADRLSEFSEWIGGEGVPLSYHPHMGTAIETPREIDFIMQYTSDAMGLLWDTGHMYFAGGDPIAIGQKWGHRINYVHLKDVRQSVIDTMEKTRHSFIEYVIAGVFTVPGDGQINFQAVADVLYNMGFEGWVTVEAEQDPAKANPLQYAIKGRQHMVTCLTAAGYTVT